MEKQFEIVYRDPESLKPYEENAKVHDEEQIRDLANAIKRRGFDQPITVDANDVIITGHGRREAAILAKLKSVPVIVRDDLTEKEVRAKRLEDNRLSSTDYDAIKLQRELSELINNEVDVFGFDERELNVLVADMTAEMAEESLISDLEEEAERHRAEHREISEEVAGGETRITDLLGFKVVPASCGIIVGDLIAYMEEKTELFGMDAFLAYAEEISREMRGESDE
ncbi:TPA: ParB/Srx family N-terminal domain-containing protein [Raoultella planticola]